MLGVLLANTGSPAAPTPKAVRAYLAQFLSDRRVVDLPRVLWLPVLHGIILNVRPRRSARLYQRIWTEAGSPLVDTTLRLAVALQTRLDDHQPGAYRVVAGMRYGEPSIAAGLRDLCAAGCDAVQILPMFPQYSTPTSASIFDAVEAEMSAWPGALPVQRIQSYHAHPAYIDAVAAAVREAWNKGGPPECLLFSFHGIPRRCVERGDPYEAQCHTSAGMIAAALGLPQGAWQLGFQSRFGGGEWLGPASVDVLRQWAQAGVRRVDVIAPGFAVDCLETLEEIAHAARRQFQDAGGGDLRYIPALNECPLHVELLAQLIEPQEH